MGEVGQVELLHDKRGWGVEVVSGNTVRRYRYASEAQARYFAAVFELGPRVLPERSPGSRRRARVRTAA